MKILVGMKNNAHGPAEKKIVLDLSRKKITLKIAQN
jgi:hypothetical protein